MLSIKQRLVVYRKSVLKLFNAKRKLDLVISKTVDSVQKGVKFTYTIAHKVNAPDQVNTITSGWNCGWISEEGKYVWACSGKDRFIATRDWLSYV